MSASRGKWNSSRASATRASRASWTTGALGTERPAEDRGAIPGWSISDTSALKCCGVGGWIARCTRRTASPRAPCPGRSCWSSPQTPISGSPGQGRPARRAALLHDFPGHRLIRGWGAVGRPFARPTGLAGQVWSGRGQAWPVSPGMSKQGGSKIGMRQVLGWMTVLVLCCAAGAAGAEQEPDARLREAQTAFDEANKHWDAGRYADAIMCARWPFGKRPLARTIPSSPSR
jgi:hypothetical protein